MVGCNPLTRTQPFDITPTFPARYALPPILSCGRQPTKGITESREAESRMPPSTMTTRTPTCRSEGTLTDTSPCSPSLYSNSAAPQPASQPVPPQLFPSPPRGVLSAAPVAARRIRPEVNRRRGMGPAISGTEAARTDETSQPACYPGQDSRWAPARLGCCGQCLLPASLLMTCS